MSSCWGASVYRTISSQRDSYRGRRRMENGFSCCIWFAGNKTNRKTSTIISWVLRASVPGFAWPCCSGLSLENEMLSFLLGLRTVSSLGFMAVVDFKWLHHVQYHRKWSGFGWKHKVRGGFAADFYNACSSIIVPWILLALNIFPQYDTHPWIACCGQNVIS